MKQSDKAGRSINRCESSDFRQGVAIALPENRGHLLSQNGIFTASGLIAECCIILNNLNKGAVMRFFVLTVFIAFLAGCDSGIFSKQKDEPQQKQSVEEQLSTAKVELENKNLGKVVEITIKIVSEDPKNFEAYYVQSQARSLKGDLDEALKSLDEALKNGFKNFEDLKSNQNFSSLKEKKEFEALVRKYDPDSRKAENSGREVRAGDDVVIKDDGDSQTVRAGDVSITLPND